jgi:hypothetical protein
MKTILFFLGLLSFSFELFSQEIKHKPLRTVDGSIVSINNLVSSEKGTLIVFWETNNSQCYSNLENLQEAWSTNIKSLGVDLVAVCVNYDGNWAEVKPLVNGKGWDFDVYIDVNGDVKRHLGINSIPYTILLDGEKDVKCRYSGYCSGDEVQICDKIEQCLKKNGSLEDFK